MIRSCGFASTVLASRRRRNAPESRQGLISVFQEDGQWQVGGNQPEIGECRQARLGLRHF